MNKDLTIQYVNETIKAIDGFMDLDHSHDVISSNEKQQLISIKENLTNLTRKLETRELEVAVVGLEKAGKSKFSSAFVGKEGLFPSADERCTFTSTKLQYSSEDYAEVEFYGKDEFTRKLEAMLNEVKFPNGRFDTIQLNTFEQHFEGLKSIDENLYRKHSSKTEADIVDIITGRNDIEKLLGHANKKFSDLGSSELKNYITDKHISRAVKNVTFYSSNLKGLENIILYDVPGFDSPTQVHLDQTIQKLRDVDAIVMVKNIKEPSLKGGEVDILVQNGDMDGIKLYEKLFVFGSKADLVSGLGDLHKNKETLKTGLSKSLKHNFNSNRLYTGCLDKNFENHLESFGSKTELEELKDGLRYYNEVERGLILEKRITKATESVKSLFRDVSTRNADFGTSIDGNKFDLYGELLDNSRKELLDRLSKFINAQKKEIKEKYLFTTAFNERVDSVVPVVDMQYLNDISEQISSSDTRSVVDFNELNRKVRDKATHQIKESFIQLVLSVSKDRAEEIENGTIEIFLTALGVSKNHPKYEILKDKTKNYIENSTEGKGFDDAGFKVIVDRFTVDLIDTMIGFPLGEKSRKDRFDLGKNDLYMLSLFSTNHPTSSHYKSDLVARVLSQKSIIQGGNSVEVDYFDVIKSAIVAKGAGGDYVGDLAKVVVEKGLAKNIPIDLLKNAISNIKRLPTSPMDAAFFVFNIKRQLLCPIPRQLS